MLSTAFFAATLAAYFLDAPIPVFVALSFATLIALGRELIQTINELKAANKQLKEANNQ